MCLDFLFKSDLVIYVLPDAFLFHLNYLIILRYNFSCYILTTLIVSVMSVVMPLHSFLTSIIVSPDHFLFSLAKGL